MRLTVLGCYGPYPAAGEACSGYLVEEEGTRVLIDCGPGALSRLLSYARPEQLGAVLLSHLHYDHMSDLLAMRYELDYSGRLEKLPLYLPDEPMPVRALLCEGLYEARPVQPISIGAMRFSFLPAVHPVPGYSIRIEARGRTIVYTGDTNWHDDLVPFCRDCDLLLADAALTASMWTAQSPHMSGALCGQLASQAGAGDLVLTHLRPDVREELVLNEAVTYFPAARLARAHMALDI